MLIELLVGSLANMALKNLERTGKFNLRKGKLQIWKKLTTQHAFVSLQNRSVYIQRDVRVRHFSIQAFEVLQNLPIKIVFV